MAASAQLKYGEECDKQCFYDIGELPRVELPLSEEDFQQIRLGELQQVTPLHIQECMQDRWLICNPTGSGRIAVLDSLAYILLQKFGTPKLLRTVMMEFKDASHESIEVTVALFYKA